MEVLGLTGLPQPGDVFQVADAAKARQIAAFREEQAKNRALGAKGRPSDARIAAGANCRRRDERAADHHQGRRAGLGGGAGRYARETCRRKGQDSNHSRRRRRGQRIGRAAGVGVQCDHHRVQRAAGSKRRRHRGARARRHPSALGHLQRDRRDEEGDDRTPRTDIQGSPHRRGRRAQYVQGAEVRHDCRLHGHRGAHHPRRRHAGATAARQRRGLSGQDRIAPPLQGRCLTK